MSFSNSLNKAASRHVVVIAAASTAAAGILLIGVPTIRLMTLHARLDKAVTNFWSMGPYAKQAAARSSQQALLPPAVARDCDSDSDGNDGEYRIFYDVATKTVPKAQLAQLAQGGLEAGHSYEDVLTKYLRHTMVGFQGFPQAWVLWLAAGREGRRTFAKRYVAKLPFEPGDVVNGVYEVLKREGNVVVFGMIAPGGGAVEGRLVVSIGDERERLDARTGTWVAVAQTEREGEGEGAGEGAGAAVVVKNETFMWVRRDEGVVMPLERRVPRWLHEVASWWLMDEGTKWLATTAGGLN